MFRRKIFEQLQTWYAKDDRKPLILSGARQIGKMSSPKIALQFL